MGEDPEKSKRLNVGKGVKKVSTVVILEASLLLPIALANSVVQQLRNMSEDLQVFL